MWFFGLQAEGEEEEAEQPEIEGFENLPPIPKPMLKPLPPLVKEPTGSGVNRKSYYVATKRELPRLSKLDEN